MKKGDTVVQGGVDMGYKRKRWLEVNAIEMSKVVGKNGRVIAIEPDLKNRALLKEYISSQKNSNITLVEKAIWNEKKTIKFYGGKRTNDSVLAIVPKVERTLDHMDESYDVETDTIDNILTELKIKEISHICLTINGAELEAIDGMKDTIRNSKDLSLYVASGPAQQFRDLTEDGTPLNEAICKKLNDLAINTVLDKDGWIIGRK